MPGYGTRPQRLLRFGLWTIAACAVAYAWAWSLSSYAVGVDLEIPLRAAGRWVAGGQPYLSSAFTNQGGATQPFLYPPYVLPLLAPLTQLPRAVVLVPWLGLLVAVAFATCRTLGVPARWIPAVLVWPPFAEPLIGGNVQILLFAAFVALYWSSSHGGVGRDIADPTERDSRIGLKAGAIMFLKIGQFQPLLHVGRWRWKAAMLAVAMAGGFAFVTLPLVGPEAWGDWLEQLLRATNGDWLLGGFALPRLLPGIGLVISAMACLGVLFLRTRDAGAAIGILSVIGAPSLYIFGLLFILPAMLRVRREVALVAAILVATYTYAGAWAAVVLVALAYAAASRLPALREPEGHAWALGRATSHSRATTINGLNAKASPRGL